MGSIAFTPDANKKYTVKLTEPQSDSTYEINDIRLQGIILHLVENSKENIIFKILQSPLLKAQKIFLRVQSKGRVYSLAAGMDKDSLQIKLSAKDFS